jgi:class 3 adenylate cyclase
VIIVSGVHDIQSLSRKLSRHYSKISEFTKGDNLLELENLVRDLLGSNLARSAAHPVDLSDLIEDVVYDFAFLKLDIVSHSAIYASNRSPLIDETLNAFEYFVESEVNSSQGHILSWQGDGGLVVFVTGDKVANCSEVALTILYALRKFNDNENKTNEEIRLRMACHQGTARYKANHGRIHSSAINFVCHLEAEGTGVNAISVSEEFYKELPEKTRNRFAEKGEFEGIKIYEHIFKIMSLG